MRVHALEALLFRPAQLFAPNAVLGAKLSIVTHKAQTTRNSVLGIYDDDNAQVRALLGWRKSLSHCVCARAHARTRACVRAYAH